MVAYLCFKAIVMEAQRTSYNNVKYPNTVKIHYPSERQQYKSKQRKTIRSKRNRYTLIYISLGYHHIPSPLIGMKFNYLQIEKESKNGMSQFMGEGLGKLKIAFYVSSQNGKYHKSNCHPFENFKLVQNIPSSKYHFKKIPCVWYCQYYDNCQN